MSFLLLQKVFASVRSGLRSAGAHLIATSKHYVGHFVWAGALAAGAVIYHLAFASGSDAAGANSAAALNEPGAPVVLMTNHGPPAQGVKGIPEASGPVCQTDAWGRFTLDEEGHPLSTAPCWGKEGTVLILSLHGYVWRRKVSRDKDGSILPIILDA